MSVRGLPKGQFRVGGSGVPEWGTVEFISGHYQSTHNDDPTCPVMEEDEFTIITAGVSGSNYMYSIGYNEGDLAAQLLGKHHVSSWVAVEVGMVRPYPSTAGTHDTNVNMAFGATNSPGWTWQHFRAMPGFRGASVAYQRYTGASSHQFTVAPFTNPMTNPGGLCIVGAYKEDDAGYWPYKLNAGSADWTIGGAYGVYAIMAYCILPTDEIYTPISLTFGSDSDLGNAIWGGVCVYLR